MKHISLLSPFVLILLAPWSPLTYGAERIPVEAISVSRVENNPSPSPFGMTVTKNGKLIAKAGPVFTEGGDYNGLILPYLLSNPKPISYPRWAIRQGWQGTFVIAVEILTDGTVGLYKVTRSTGHHMLDNRATEVVRTWKFHPAMKEGKALRTCIEIPIVFQAVDE